MDGKITMSGSYNGNSRLTPFKMPAIVGRVLVNRGIHMSMWNGRREVINSKEDDDIDSLEKAQEAIKYLEAQNKALQAQVNTQTQFMQTVILELITAIKEKPAPVPPKTGLAAYLESKPNGSAAAAKPAGKLPG